MGNPMSALSQGSGAHMERIDAARLNESEQSFAGAVELFEMRCRSLNLSPDTLIWYENVLGGFTDFLSVHPDNPTPRATKPLHVRAYFDFLRGKTTKIGRKVSPGSIRRFYVGIKTFFGFLERERVVLTSPFAFVEKPKGPKTLIPSGSAGLLAGTPPEGVDARSIQPFYTGILARMTGMAISIGIENEEFVFTAIPEAAPAISVPVEAAIPVGGTETTAPAPSA